MEVNERGGEKVRKKENYKLNNKMSFSLFG